MTSRGLRSLQAFRRKPKPETAPSHSCRHCGGKVRVGPYTILAGGNMYLRPEDFETADVIVDLTNGAWWDKQQHNVRLRPNAMLMPLPLVDFGGVPDNWKSQLEQLVSRVLARGSVVLAFCAGSHGRTGCFLGSLIALLESPEETPDPIAAVRARHCKRAVETLAQAEAIFALRGQALPEKYRAEFSSRKHHS
jgi:hypothetical protein